MRLTLGRRLVDLLPVAQRTNACLYTFSWNQLVFASVSGTSQGWRKTTTGVALILCQTSYHTCARVNVLRVCSFSSRRHPSHPACMPTLFINGEIQGLWLQNGDREILHCNAVRRVDNAMTCNRARYGRYDIHIIIMRWMTERWMKKVKCVKKQRRN